MKCYRYLMKAEEGWLAEYQLYIEKLFGML